jgi:hypothetical protein
MSTNGTRKETKAWAIGSPAKLINIDTDDVPIEEIVSDSVPTVVSKEALRLADEEQKRGRRSTLENFNDEMSVLDRPIEGDVEYIDETPKPSRLKGVALFAGIVIGMGMGGGVVLSRRHAAAQPAALVAQAAPAPVPAVAAPPVVEPVLAAQAPAAVVPAPAAEEAAAPVAEEDSAGDDDEAPAPAAASPSAWSKVKTKGHGKQARAVSASAHHRTSKTVAAKRSSRHR